MGETNFKFGPIPISFLFFASDLLFPRIRASQASFKAILTELNWFLYFSFGICLASPSPAPFFHLSNQPSNQEMRSGPAAPCNQSPSKRGKLHSIKLSKQSRSKRGKLHSIKLFRPVPFQKREITFHRTFQPVLFQKVPFQKKENYILCNFATSPVPKDGNSSIHKLTLGSFLLGPLGHFPPGF